MVQQRLPCCAEALGTLTRWERRRPPPQGVTAVVAYENRVLIRPGARRERFEEDVPDLGGVRREEHATRAGRLHDRLELLRVDLGADTDDHHAHRALRVVERLEPGDQRLLADAPLVLVL